MAPLRDHERMARLLRERPEVAARAAELRETRAYLVGRLGGTARSLRLARAAMPLLRGVLRALRRD